MQFKLWLFLLGSPSLALTAQAQKDVAACKTSMDAALKTASTPHHAYTTTTLEGKSRAAEAIMVNSKNYVLVRGRWIASPMNLADLVKQEKENIDSAKVYTCRAVRDEAVGGQAATVYHVHTENGDLKSDGDVWIAKSAGLVVRVEEDVDQGEGVKMHMSTRYDYSNVKAPPGV